MGFGNPLNALGDAIQTGWGSIAGGGLTDDEKKRKAALEAAAAQSGSFADQGQNYYTQLGQEAGGARNYLRSIAEGQNSVSAEQLRQANLQALASQRSMASSASPSNAVAASRNAMLNMQRQQSGLAGQQAVAGIAERNAAAQQLNQVLMQQRQQDLQAAIEARRNQMTGLGAGQPYARDPGLMGVISQGAAAYGSATGKKPG
jgi:hypothetical protein